MLRRDRPPTDPLVAAWVAGLALLLVAMTAGVAITSGPPSWTIGEPWADPEPHGMSHVVEALGPLTADPVDRDQGATRLYVRCRRNAAGDTTVRLGAHAPGGRGDSHPRTAVLESPRAGRIGGAAVERYDSGAWHSIPLDESALHKLRRADGLRVILTGEGTRFVRLHPARGLRTALDRLLDACETTDSH